MTIQEAIRAYLTSTSSVTAALGQRVYVSALPENPTYPAAVLKTLTTGREHSQDGPSGFATGTFDIDVVAPTLGAAKPAADLVRVALVGFRGSMGGGSGVTIDGVFDEDESHDYDDEKALHIVTLTVSIQYLE